MEQKNKLDLLLSRLLQNECTAEEKTAFFRLIETIPDDELAIHLEKAWSFYEKPTHVLDEETSLLIRNKILNQKNSGGRLGWLKGRRGYWAAAAVFVVALSAVLMLYRTPGKKAPEIAVTHPPAEISAPAVSRATISLGNGRKLAVGEGTSGRLTSEEGVDVNKGADGFISYTNNAAVKAPVYNTLENPKGSRMIALALSDGTKVWLNSETKLRFPIVFAGNERRVEVLGEAYFEVAKNAAKPFRVTTGSMTIEVLGTSFNVHAYADETSVKTTLLEGKVKLTEGTRTASLAPGQEAQLNINSPAPFKIISDADVDKAVAWKNGTFQFDDIDLREIMRQISRWYDVDVVYEKEPANEKFGGNIRMDAPLSDVLKMLEGNGVHCRVEGRKIIVGP